MGSRYSEGFNQLLLQADVLALCDSYVMNITLVREGRGFPGRIDVRKARDSYWSECQQFNEWKPEWEQAFKDRYANMFAKHYTEFLQGAFSFEAAEQFMRSTGMWTLVQSELKEGSQKWRNSQSVSGHVQ